MITRDREELLERDDVLAHVEHLGAEIRDDPAGRLFLIEGVAGIGKTVVVDEICQRLGKAGMTVLRATGAELESALAYGVVRQIFTPETIDAASDPAIWDGAASLARPVVDPAHAVPTRDIDPAAAMHGLWWLCVALIHRAPLVIAVDDAHWADMSSLRWIAYLAARIVDLPVLVVLATRTIDPETGQGQVLAELAGGGDAAVLRPLSPAASARLIRRAVAPSVPDDVCQACFAATDGNPFYLRDLVTEGGGALLTLDVAQVGAMAPLRTARSVTARLAGLGVEATRLARAIAVFGAPIALRHSARLAELDMDTAEATADRLAAAGILLDVRPPQFAHPIVRSAVYQSLPSGARSTVHREAGRILHEAGADPTAVGVALLPAEPHADQGVVAMLRAAAVAARARGDLHAATTYLDRALREPVAPVGRAAVLLELGSAERRMFDPRAVGHLRSALESAEDSTGRISVAFELARALNQPDDLDESLRIIARVSDEVAESSEAAALLETNRIALAGLHVTDEPVNTTKAYDLLTRLDPQTRGARLLRAVVAADRLYQGASLRTTLPLLDEAVGDDPAAIVGDINLTTYVAYAAMLCDRVAEAECILDAALARAQRTGSAPAAGQVWSFRSQVYLRLGRVSDAEADARLAVDALGGLDLIPIAPLPVDALIERDQSTEALTLLQRLGLAGDLPPWLPGLVVIARRIALWTALGETAAAIADLDEAERRAQRLGADFVAVPWRAEGALACLAAGDEDRARHLAEVNLLLARRFGGPGALSLALRVAGSLRGGAEGLTLLHEAVGLVAGTVLLLDHVKALAALGAAQRRAGQRSTARATLSEGLRMANLCGATRVANQIQDELAVAGARRRRDHFVGSAALTASQLRVSTLAAGGATNDEIAQSLFVTPKTVERHLTNAYAALGITSRKDLTGALLLGTAVGRAQESSDGRRQFEPPGEGLDR